MVHAAIKSEKERRFIEKAPFAFGVQKPPVERFKLYFIRPSRNARVVGM
jgi:hypothetical protein